MENFSGPYLSFSMDFAEKYGLDAAVVYDCIFGMSCPLEDLEEILGFLSRESILEAIDILKTNGFLKNENDECVHILRDLIENHNISLESKGVYCFLESGGDFKQVSEEKISALINELCDCKYFMEAVSILEKVGKSC